MEESRQKLAHAIERVERAERALAEIRAARDRLFNEHIYPGNKAVDIAKAALAEAGPTDAQRLAARFMGETVPDIAVLRQDLAGAEHRLEEARQTRQGLDERERAAQSELDFARALRDEALRHVVSDSVELTALIDKFKRAQRELTTMRVALDNLTIFLPSNFRPDAVPTYADIDRACTSAWRAAIDALATDADAPLPQ